MNLKTLCGMVGVLLSASVSHGDVIYNNSVNDLSYRFNPMGLQVGDELNLAGSARYLTKLSFEYYGLSSNPSAFAGNISMRLRLYLNDGANDPAGGYPSPSTVLFDSNWLSTFGGQNLVPTSRNTLVFTAGDGLPVNGLFIPADKITFSVQFQGMGTGDELGLDIYNPTTVGSSSSDYWQFDGTTWKTMVGHDTTGTAMVMNFGSLLEASAVAVPEPGTVSLLLLGGLAFLIRRSR